MQSHRVQAIDTSADSTSAMQLQASSKKAFEEFIATSAKYKHATFSSLRTNTLCDSTIYLEFAQWMTDQRSADNSGRWKPGTIEKYLRTVVAHVVAKFPAERDFIQSTLPSNAGDSWLRSAIRKVHVFKFREAVANHESTVLQATPIYTLHMRELCKQLLLHSTTGGGNDSIERALLLALVHKSAGRPGEVGTFSFDVTRWDPHYRVLVASWPQPKTHKFKMMAVMAGRDRHLCLFTLFACAFASELFKSLPYDEEGMNFVFPKLDDKGVAGVVTKLLRDMVPEKGLRTFSAHTVPTLPDNPCGSGTSACMAHVLGMNHAHANVCVCCRFSRWRNRRDGDQ